MKKKIKIKKVGKIAYDSEFFQRLLQSLDSVIQKTEYQSIVGLDVRELSSLISKRLVKVMVDKRLLNAKGGVLSDGRANYVAEILPYLSCTELNLLEVNPDEFISKFSVHPQSKKETSLVCYLKNQEDPQSTSFILEKKWMEAKQSLFDRFSFPIEGYDISAEFDVAYYRSPFELFSRNEIEDILGEIEGVY